MAWQGLIHAYREFLPVGESTPVITLSEGNTPLIRADRLRQMLGLSCEVYLKYDGANPTGSFKDRGMTVAMSKAVEGDMQKALKRLNHLEVVAQDTVCIRVEGAED